MAYLDSSGLSYFWGKIKAALTKKQDKIDASGLLKGDGAGGVSTAAAGTDYATPAQLAAKQNALNINLANVGDMIRVNQVSAYVATKFAVAKAGQDYMKTGNIVKQTLVSTPTTPSEEYAINWQYG